jgi:hypothetical protein
VPHWAVFACGAAAEQGDATRGGYAQYPDATITGACSRSSTALQREALLLVVSPRIADQRRNLPNSVSLNAGSDLPPMLLRLQRRVAAADCYWEGRSVRPARRALQVLPGLSFGSQACSIVARRHTYLSPSPSCLTRALHFESSITSQCMASR